MHSLVIYLCPNWRSNLPPWPIEMTLSPTGLPSEGQHSTSVGPFKRVPWRKNAFSLVDLSTAEILVGNYLWCMGCILLKVFIEGKLPSLKEEHDFFGNGWKLLRDKCRKYDGWSSWQLSLGVKAKEWGRDLEAGLLSKGLSTPASREDRAAGRIAQTPKRTTLNKSVLIQIWISSGLFQSIQLRFLFLFFLASEKGEL